MEEASILSDKIVIMSKGKGIRNFFDFSFVVSALGSSLHLKNKYGPGYIVGKLSYKFTQ